MIQESHRHNISKMYQLNRWCFTSTTKALNWYHTNTSNYKHHWFKWNQIKSVTKTYYVYKKNVSAVIFHQLFKKSEYLIFSSLINFNFSSILPLKILEFKQKALTDFPFKGCWIYDIWRKSKGYRKPNAKRGNREINSFSINYAKHRCTLSY